MPDSFKPDYKASQWDTADEEINSLFARGPKLSKAPTLQPGVGQTISLHASPTAKNSAFLISVFAVNSTLFSSLLFKHKMAFNTNSKSDFNLWFDDWCFSMMVTIFVADFASNIKGQSKKINQLLSCSGLNGCR